MLCSLARSKESRRGRRYDESAVVGCQESSHHQQQYQDRGGGALLKIGGDLFKFMFLGFFKNCNSEDCLNYRMQAWDLHSTEFTFIRVVVRFRNPGGLIVI